MRFDFFIAKRIYSDLGVKGNFSRPAIRIATSGIAIGTVVMLLSITILQGFKKEISSKVLAFGAHVQVLSLNVDQNYELSPIIIDNTLVNIIKSSLPEGKIQLFASKLGILKTDKNFCGINFKGIDERYNLDYFKQSLVRGEIPQFSSNKSTNKILISQSTASMLNLDVGMNVYSYFLSSKTMRARKFEVAGIYNTNLTDYDKSLVFTDLHTIRRLNGWDSTMVSGCEIEVPNSNDIEVYSTTLKNNIDLLNKNNDKTYGVFTLKELNPQIFSWLEILDTNIIMILVLMLCVSSVTVASGLLIIMLERINMIGILKSLGAHDYDIRNIFINFAVIIVSKGLIIGNIIAITLCYIQKNFSIISLDPSVYYIDCVPVELNLFSILLLNLLIGFVSLFIILGASFLISIGKPIRSIRFE